MGILRLRSCTDYKFCKYGPRPKYTVGQTLYVCDLVAKGIVEKVNIQRILLNPSCNPYVVVYIDKLNSVYIEYELCTVEEAAVVYNAYLQAKLLDEEKAKLCSTRSTPNYKRLPGKDC